VSFNTQFNVLKLMNYLVIMTFPKAPEQCGSNTLTNSESDWSHRETELSQTTSDLSLRVLILD